MLWRGSYETGDLRQWTFTQANPGGALVVGAPHPVREGKYSLRLEVRPADDPINGHGERAQILKHTGEGPGVESWWAWSTYFPHDFQPAPNTTWNIFADWHHWKDGGVDGQANANFIINTGVFPAQIQLHTFGGQSVNQNQRVFTLAPFERGKWYDFIFHVRWATDNTGFLEIWLNGRQVVAKTHTPTAYVGHSIYLMLAYYRPEGTPGTAIVYHDAMRRGQSYADLVAAGSVKRRPARIKWIRRPRLLPSEKLAIRARIRGPKVVRIVVRGPRGRVLGSGWAKVARNGRITRNLPLRRWRGQRRLRIAIEYRAGAHTHRTARRVKLPRRQVRAAARH
jgi:hypothetical protein